MLNPKPSVFSPCCGLCYLQMPQGRRHFKHTADLHFFTFNCYHWLPYLGTTRLCDLFESAPDTLKPRAGAGEISGSIRTFA